jgi:ankyrin repeat protein
MRRLLVILGFLLAAAPAQASFYDLLNAAWANDTALARSLIEAGTEPNGGPSGYPDSYSPLQWAAYHGNIEVVHLLLAAGADTERRDFNGDRPLLWAARGGQPESIRILVEAGSPANSADDPYGLSPLHLAARAASPEAIAALVTASADLDAVDQSNTTALAEAVLTQNLRSVYLLLDAGADPNIADDILGDTPLHLAAERQNTGIVRLLLSAGARPIGWNSDGSDPLHLAAFRGLPDNVEALLKGGADPRALDDKGLTPLMAAIEGKRHEVWDNDRSAELLVPFVDDITATFLAAADAGLPWTARSLLAVGADPNAVAADGTSALAMAARLDGIPATALVEAMIKMGVDIHRFGPQSLLSAAQHDSLAIANRLLEFGIPIDGAADGPPVLAAAQAGSLAMVQFLLARGAEPVAPDRVELAKFTPLDLFVLAQGQQSRALDTTGMAIRQALEDLQVRQIAARKLLIAAIVAR